MTSKAGYRWIRLIFSVALLYFVYGETGWATTTAIALGILGHELHAFAYEKLALCIIYLTKR